MNFAVGELLERNLVPFICHGLASGRDQRPATAA
jgi:hypothetical protein